MAPDGARACPVCGGGVALLETRQDGGGEPALVYGCTDGACGGHLEVVEDRDAAVANQPTGGDGIGA